MINPPKDVAEGSVHRPPENLKVLQVSNLGFGFRGLGS